MSSNKCLRCRRILKDPASIERGMGGTCWKKHLAAQGMEKAANTPDSFFPFSGNVICSRTWTNRCFNIPHKLSLHSPAGMDWGYAGSGPADFALNILYQFTGNAWFANKFHQRFKFEFVANIPKEGGTIEGTTIKQWISERVFEMVNDMDVEVIAGKDYELQKVLKLVKEPDFLGTMQVNEKGELQL